MRFDIITIFPKIFNSYFSESILKRAIKRKIVTVKVHNLREYSRNKHKKVDDRPYGGGAGMVLMAEPIVRAVARIKSEIRNPKSETKIVIFSAKGKQFNQKTAYDWARRYKRIIIVSGRYEGIDERVRQITKAEEISIGPYVLTDGDLAAMVVISAITRLIPGAIKLESLQEETHWNLLTSKEKDGPGGKGLEYPHYTRPEILKHKGRKYAAPKILLTGDHKKIAEWRGKHAK